MKGKKTMAAAMSSLMVAGLFGTAFPVSAETVSSKDSMVVIANETSQSVDPYSNSGMGLMACRQVFDTLFHRDEEGNVIPGLAESWEESEDSKQIILHLRQDSYFTDGTPVNADAVVYSYEQVIAAGVPVGYVMAGMIESFEKTDDYTVVITKTSPYSAIYAYLAAVFFIIDPNQAPEDRAAEAIGSGSYIITERDEATGTIYLTANEDYYDVVPAVKNVELRAPVESATSLVALETGEVDMASTLTADDRAIAADEGLIVDGSYIGYNETALLFFGEPYESDENLRKAIACAINKENAAIFSGYDDSVLSSDLFPEKIMGDYAGLVSTPEYDPEAAAAYLSESSYDGSVLEINIMSGYENAAVSVMSDLKEIGIETTINNIDSAAFYEKLLNKELGMSIFQIGGNSSSMEDFVEAFTSNGRYGAYGIPISQEVEDLLAKMKDEWTVEERWDDAVQALTLQVENTPIVPLYQDPSYVVYGEDLQGYYPLCGMLNTVYFE